MMMLIFSVNFIKSAILCEREHSLVLFAQFGYRNVKMENILNFYFLNYYAGNNHRFMDGRENTDPKVLKRLNKYPKRDQR